MLPTVSPRPIRSRFAVHINRVDVVQASPSAERPARHALAAAGLILSVVALNLAYLVFDCPFDLAPDEAHYWHWSRHLDAAYYSKGPLVAWLIRASCELFAGLSIALVGTESLAVRLPALACHALLLAGVYVLTAEVFRDSRTALLVLSLAVTVPPLTAGAILMTIDAPFLACWCWSLVFTWRAVTRGEPRWWLAAGGCCGLGVLAKFPMLLFPIAVAAYLLCHPERRRQLRRPGFALMLMVVGLASLPILVWNVAHEWVSVQHVFGQVGGGNAVRWQSPLAFLGGQFGFLLGYWFVAFLGAAWVFRPWRPAAGDGLAFLWFLSVPVWAVFFLASFRTAGQVNWPAAAYVAGFPLTVAWIRRQLASSTFWYRRFAQGCLAFGIGLGLLLTFMAHFPNSLLRPVVMTMLAPATESRPTPLRKLDPTCRLQGWRTLAAEVDAIRERLKRDTGEDPVLAGMVWTVPGELSFYCKGHPETYSLGLALGDRHSQYDLWRPNPVADAQAFRGRAFVYVGEEIPGMADLFDRVEPVIGVTHLTDGYPVATWKVWVGHGFRGFRDLPTRTGY